MSQTKVGELGSTKNHDMEEDRRKLKIRLFVDKISKITEAEIVKSLIATYLQKH